MKKIPVGILGATGMVGQRLITFLQNHPYFEVVCLAASVRSAGKRYKEAVNDRWVMEEKIPNSIVNMIVLAVEKDMEQIAKQARLVFSALDMDKDQIREIENKFASLGMAVVSNNSAHRWTKNVPMIMPEINPEHLKLIRSQKTKGFIVVKPNCSIQSYVPMLTPLLKYGIKKVVVTTLQAVSGAGKTMASWPQMEDNIIPYIAGEEEKSEKEPLKIWGQKVNISATCIRVPLEDGHMASVSVWFKKKVTKEQIINEWKRFNPLKNFNLPSAPDPFITVMGEEDRPQTKLDRNLGKGMGVSVGRLREREGEFQFVGLSHNTIRGAAGGAVLTAELLKVKGYI